VFNFRRPPHLVQDDNEEFANMEYGAQSRHSKKTKKTKLATPPIPPLLYKDVPSTNNVHDWSDGAEVNLQQSSSTYLQASQIPLITTPDEHTIEMQCEQKSSDNNKSAVDSDSASSEHFDNDNETVYEDTSTDQWADEAISAISEQLPTTSSASASKHASQTGKSEAYLCKDSKHVKVPVRQTALGLARKADSDVS